MVGHVLAIQRYFESAINGASPTMNPMHDPHVHAGDDPAGAWAATRDALLEALDHPDVLHRVVESWNGPKPVDEIIGFNVADTTVHSWDLARAIGGDDRLDLGLVQHALVLVEPIADGMRGPMLFGDRVATPDTADPQSQLLALTGRQP